MEEKGWVGWQFHALVLVSLTLNAWNSIPADCDETFGYWEPLHKLLYGYGLQVWEYSPEFAIRPYAYILFHYWPARLFGSLDKVLLYRMVRLMLGLFAWYCQCSLVMGLNKRVAQLSAVLFAVSPGMVQASIALLPNSLSMNITSLIWAFYLRGQDNRVTLLVILLTVLGWPYAIVSTLITMITTMQLTITTRDQTVIPVSQIPLLQWIKMLARRWTIAMVFGICYILLPVVLIDRYYYGRWNIANLNAIVYNLFSVGPNVFDITSRDFLLKSLLLSFNVFGVLALLYPLVQREKAGLRMWMTVIFTVILFSSQKHQEERFLYHVYPLIIVLAAMALDAALRWNSPFLRLSFKAILVGGLILSLLRISAMVQYYKGPTNLIENLKIPKGLICMADEWHRFPSHFFLPKDQRIAFVKLHFKGLLPQYYPESTSSTVNKFNGLNQGVAEHYTDPSKCDYFLLSVGESKQLTLDLWMVDCRQYIDSARSRAITRWLYLPFLSPTMQSFCLFQQKTKE
jgi:alpha-1,2-mannosyltransferase